MTAEEQAAIDSVECPNCHAPAGKACILGSSFGWGPAAAKRSRPHPERVHEYRRTRVHVYVRPQ